MAGSQPGPGAQLVDGAVVDPVTDLEQFSLPAGSPGALMLEGPRAAWLHPRRAVSMAPVIPLPAPAGRPGRLVRLPDGRMGMTPSGLHAAAAAHLAVVPSGPPPVNVDPPLGAQVIQSLPDGSVIVLPLPPAYAGDDSGVINTAALQASGAAGTGGVVRLGPYAYNCQSLIVLPQQATLGTTGGGPVSLVGVKGATRLLHNFAGTLLYSHRTSGYGAQYGLADQKPCGEIRNIIFDGTGAGAGSIGLDTGDGWGIRVIDCDIVNYTSQPTVSCAAGTPNTFSLAAGLSLPNGFPVMFLSGAIPAPFAGGIVYYVVNTSGNSFQLALTPGGAAVGGAGTVAGLTINGAVGLYITERVFWTEKARFRCDLKHNVIACIMDTQVPASAQSHEYNEYDFFLFSDAGQQGIVVATGVYNGGDKLVIRGNMSRSNGSGAAPPGNIALLTVSGSDGVGDASNLSAVEIEIKAEANPGNGSGTTYPFLIYSDGTGYIKDCHGNIRANTFTNSVLNGAEFSFSGTINGDGALVAAYPGAPGTSSTTVPIGTQPAFPGLGVTQQNYGPDALVSVQGGTVTGINVNGQATGATSGVFFLRAGGTISVGGTVAPTTYAWCPATRSVF